MSSLLSDLKGKLEEFAREHKDAINSDPAFRAQFNEMCQAAGVDPLASSKGFWAQILGVGDFFYEIGIQAVDVCLATRAENGGLLEVGELTRLVNGRRGPRKQQVTQEDVLTAIDKLSVLGSGFAVFRLGRKTVVRSVPVELNGDHTDLLAAAQENGHVSMASVRAKLGWPEDRAASVLHVLLHQGMAMVDDQGPGGERLYWFPSLIG